MEDGLAAGHVKVRLHGEKLTGAFALTHTKMGGNDKNWLLVKVDDEGADRRRKPADDAARVGRQRAHQRGPARRLILRDALSRTRARSSADRRPDGPIARSCARFPERTGRAQRLRRFSFSVARPRPLARRRMSFHGSARRLSRRRTPSMSRPAGSTRESSSHSRGTATWPPGLGRHRVGRDGGLAVAVAPDVEVDAVPAGGLAVLEREEVRVPVDEHVGEADRELAHLVVVRGRPQRHDDVVAPRPGGLQERRQPEVVEQVTDQPHPAADRREVLDRRVEVDHQLDGACRAGRPCSATCAG